MEKLKESLYKNGFKYVLHHRSDLAAIYGQYSLDNLKKPVMYEVFRIVITKESKMPNGEIRGEHETFPSNSVFGKWAWTYSKLEHAMSKFKEIEAKELARK
jgi:hypothetical protein